MNTYTCAICATFNLDCHCDPSLDKLIIPEDSIACGILPGEANPFYGKKHTTESKKRMSISKTNYIPWNKGKPASEKERQRLIKMCENRIPWNKHKKGLQVPWNKGKTKCQNFPIMQCPHCNKFVAHKRWHFDNCRSRQQQQNQNLIS